MKRIIQRVAALVCGLMIGVAAWGGLETVTHISDLNSSWPLGSDLASTSDDHIRNIKVALKTDFPNITGPVTGTQTQLNALTGFTASPTWTGNHIFRTGSASGTEGLKLDNSAGDARFGFYSAGTETGIIQSNTNTLAISGVGASTTLSLGVNNGTALSIVAAGNATIASPSSGSALTTNSGAAATQSIDIKGAASGTAASYVKFTAQNGSAVGFFGVGGSAQTLSTGASAGDFVMRADNGNIALSGNGGSSVGLKVTTGNAVQGLGPVAAALVDMTPDKSTFTGTLTGMTAGTTGTVSWSRMGNIVTVYIASAISGTSNTTAMTMTGLPSAIQPATTQIGTCPVTDSSNGTIIGSWSITGGTITFGRTVLNVSVMQYAQAFQNSGTKGLPAGWTITYAVN